MNFPEELRHLLSATSKKYLYLFGGSIKYMLTNKHANLAIQRRQSVLTAWLSWIHALLLYHIQPRYFFFHGFSFVRGI